MGSGRDGNLSAWRELGDFLMARYLFGGSLTDFGIESPSDNDGNVVALLEASGTVWDSEDGGDQYTDLLDETGTSPQETVATDGDGFLVPFQGPDSVHAAYLDFGTDRRFFIVSQQWVEETREVSDDRYLGFVDVSDGLEARPSGMARVFWIGGTSQPVNMNDGDVWLAEVAEGS